MKEYWSIPGPKKAPHVDCIAFYKYDGQNVRIEWSKKQGWYKYGSRTVLMDEDTAILGQAVPLFEAKYAESLEKTVLDHKDFREHAKQNGFIVYCELHGPNSFCGIHVPGEELTVTLLDVNINKRGIVIPRQFIRAFGHLDIPPVIYEGNFNKKFIQDVWDGKYPVKEGVVAKGSLPGKSAQHSLWFSKAKTRWWMEELRKRAIINTALQKVLNDNIAEQENETTASN